MKKKLTFIFLLIGQIVTAQIIHQPSQFDKFINDKKIEWAAYSSDSFYFNKSRLNDLLVKRFAVNKIKASLPIIARSAEINSFQYLLKDSIDKLILTEGHKVIPLYDSNGNVVKANIFQKNNNASVYNITEVTQILFVEKGILKSYIPFVTPTLPLFLSSGKYLGESYYFNTAYNFKHNYKQRKRHKVIFLEQISKPVKLKPADGESNLKELYGKNLIETLWPYIMQNKIDLFSKDGKKLMATADLNNTSGISDIIIVPLYDSVNAVYTYKSEYSKLTPTAFTHAVLVQDWYYNQTKNIVFNKIKEMYLYVDDDSKTALPVLKLVFK